MPQKNGEIPKTQLRAVGVRLSKPTRATAFVLGIAGLGAGGVAVFITHLEAGPVGLMVVGLIFMIIALGGVLPSRLKVGENEATWEVERQAVEDFVERVAEETPAESRPKLLDALDNLAEDAPIVASRAYSAALYEDRVLREIQNILRKIPSSDSNDQPIKLTTQLTSDKQQMDGILEGPTGRLIAVEIKFSTRRLASTWIDVMHQKLLQESQAWRGLGMMLLITGDSLTPRLEERVKQYPEIQHIIYRGPEDREILKLVIYKLMKIE